MKLRLTTFLILFLALFSACAGGNARAARSGAGWRFLGERMVNGRVDRDVIDVGPRDGVFQKLEVRVKGSALEMYDIKIVFGNGEDMHPDTRLVFGKGSWSRVIDLPGNSRVVRRVEFKYGNLPGGGRARVKLYGN